MTILLSALAVETLALVNLCVAWRLCRAHRELQRLIVLGIAFCTASALAVLIGVVTEVSL